MTPKDKEENLPPDTLNADKTIQMGKFGRPHGLAGWIYVVSFTDPSDNILQYLPWQIHLPRDPHSSSWIIETLTDSKLHQDKLLVLLSDYTDRDKASLLTHQGIFINTSQLPTLEQDDYYWHQLCGLNVTNTEGIALGRVDLVFNSGANDVLVLTDCPQEKGKRARRERLIPYTQDVVKQIDLAQQTLVVNWHPDD